MILKLFSSEPLATQAVLDNDLVLLGDLSKTAFPLLEMKNKRGFDAIEIAGYLKKESALHIIRSEKNKDFTIRIKGENENRTVSKEEFEKAFSMTYWPHLYFREYNTFVKVINNCPYLLRTDLFAEDHINLGKFYDEEIKEGYIAKTSVRWVSDRMGYGLFAEEHLSKGAYIGEYTGEVRRLYRLSPDYNVYCFHYPTKFWSRNYYIIDGKTIGNELRFANHDNNPNMKPRWIVKSGLLHMIFNAKVPIKKGTQLTFDYGMRKIGVSSLENGKN